MNFGVKIIKMDEYTKYLNDCVLKAAEAIRERRSTPEGRREMDFELDMLERDCILSTGESARQERVAAYELRNKKYIG